MYNAKLDTFSSPNVTGGMSISGLGFTPKIILFFGNSLNSLGVGADASLLYGAAVSLESQFSLGFLGKDAYAASPVHVNSWQDDLNCLTLQDYDGTQLLKANLLSLDTDGFTLNFSVASVRSFAYLALGGDELENVVLGSFAAPSLSGAVEVDGVGFLPDCVVFSSAGIEFSGAHNNVNFLALAFGFLINEELQKDVAGLVSNVNPTVAASIQKSTECFGTLFNSTTLREEANFVSINEDGFTVNFINASNATRIYFIAFKGGSYTVKKFDSPIQEVLNEEVIQSKTVQYQGYGVMPAALFLISSNQISSVSIQNSFLFSLGVFDNSGLEKLAMFAGFENGDTVTNASQEMINTKVLRFLNPASALPTLNDEADLDSLDELGFSLNWDNLDLAAREVLVLSIGNQNELYLRRNLNASA